MKQGNKVKTVKTVKAVEANPLEQMMEMMKSQAELIANLQNQIATKGKNPTSKPMKTKEPVKDNGLSAEQVCKLFKSGIKVVETQKGFSAKGEWSRDIYEVNDKARTAFSSLWDNRPDEAKKAKALLAADGYETGFCKGYFGKRWFSWK